MHRASRGQHAIVDSVIHSTVGSIARLRSLQSHAHLDGTSAPNRLLEQQHRAPQHTTIRSTSREAKQVTHSWSAAAAAALPALPTRASVVELVERLVDFLLLLGLLLCCLRVDLECRIARARGSHIGVIGGIERAAPPVLADSGLCSRLAARQLGCVNLVARPLLERLLKKLLHSPLERRISANARARHALLQLCAARLLLSAASACHHLARRLRAVPRRGGGGGTALARAGHRARGASHAAWRGSRAIRAVRLRRTCRRRAGGSVVWLLPRSDRACGCASRSGAIGAAARVGGRNGSARLLDHVEVAAVKVLRRDVGARHLRILHAQHTDPTAQIVL
eukprot:scaffold256463_cov28-Tisochrysis_lutea.AAC.2